jgi:CxxC motif-containing protein
MNQEEITKLICITCPKGCTLEVQRDGDTVIKVEQGCKRGHEYAQWSLRP